jgi:hypothetical protein
MYYVTIQLVSKLDKRSLKMMFHYVFGIRALKQ